MEILRLSQVFTPGGFPSVTYVGREHLELEKKISRARAKGFAFNVVTGPTKSGKSVLCRRVLQDQKLVIVEGGQVRLEADFWSHVGYQLNVASQATKTVLGTATGGASLEASFGIPGGPGVKAGGSAGGSSQSGSAVTYNNVAILSAINALKASGAALLVDDFHYIPQDVQKAVIQALKAAVFDGLTVFLLAVPHRAFDPITVENEVEGRFKHIEIPPWSLDDLLLIPHQGFPALNVMVSKEIETRICEESFKNPLLVQEVCSELCLLNDVSETQERRCKLDVGKLPEAFTEIAESKGFPKFQKLKKGPVSRGGRTSRPLKGGEAEDIYSVILRAVANLGPREVTEYDDLRNAMKELIADPSAMPQKNEVTSALSHMTKIAQDKIEGEPPLEWVKNSNELVITDPFLRFYMKWAIRMHRSMDAA